MQSFFSWMDSVPFKNTKMRALAVELENVNSSCIVPELVDDGSKALSGPLEGALISGDPSLSRSHS